MAKRPWQVLTRFRADRVQGVYHSMPAPSWRVYRRYKKESQARQGMEALREQQGHKLEFTITKERSQ